MVSSRRWAGEEAGLPVCSIVPRLCNPRARFGVLGTLLGVANGPAFCPTPEI